MGHPTRHLEEISTRCLVKNPLLDVYLVEQMIWAIKGAGGPFSPWAPYRGLAHRPQIFELGMTTLTQNS